VPLWQNSLTFFEKLTIIPLAMKMILFVLFLSSFVSGTERELWKVELFDGTSKKSGSIEIKKAQVFLEDTVISMKDVMNILFMKEKTDEVNGSIQEDVKEIINEANRLERKYPDAGGIILIDDDEILLRPDGTRRYEYHFAAMILKNSKKRWANVKLYFEEERSRIKVVLARTIKPDGTIYNLPEEDIKIVKPKSGMVFFEKGKSVQFELPNVSIGDIIEYEYTEEVFNPWNKKILNIDHYFQTTEPVDLSRLMVAIPESLSLTVGKRNINEANFLSVFSEKDGYKYYGWEMENIEPVIREPEMPPLGEVVPRIEVSNVKSWDVIFDWYSDFQLTRMRVTEEIKELAEKITEGATTEEEKVAKLYHFVQRNVRYICIKGGAASGVSGHPAEETLEKGYGDCTDKAILLATLLRAVAIKAYPVYIGTNDDVPTLITEVPCYYGNHCINEVEVDSKSIYLDATGTTSRYPSYWSADHDVYAVNAIKRTIEKTPIPPPSENERRYEYEIKISSLDCIVTFKAHYTGDWEDWLRWYWERKKDDEIKEAFEEMIHDVSPYSELVDFSLENVNALSKPFGMVLKYKLKDYIKKTGDPLLFELPELIDRYTFKEVCLSERKYPLNYATSEGIINSYTITFPENLTIAYLPEKIDLSNWTGDKELRVSYTALYTNEGNILNFRDDFKRYKRVVPASEYKNYKEFLTKISLFAKKKIVFQEITNNRPYSP